MLAHTGGTAASMDTVKTVLGMRANARARGYVHRLCAQAEPTTAGYARECGRAHSGGR